MRENLPIKMRETSSNPARNEVVSGSEDNALSNYLREISNYPVLSQDEECNLAMLAQEGDSDAKIRLIQSNLKLVFTIAKKAIHISKIPFVDLIQEGNIGLMIAAEKYNYKLGYRFSTYAAWWIKQSMFKAISEQSHCMKIPVYIQETLSKFSKIKSEIENANNGKAELADIAKRMNISQDKLGTFLSAYVKTVSIENGFENEDGKDMNVTDILEDENASATANTEFEELQNDIDMVISTLKEREQEVVRMRSGLGNTTRHTLEEIGNIYGVTKECIRQTELRALKKMRVSSFGQEVLSCYIN